MLTSVDDLLAVVALIFPDGPPSRLKKFRVLRAIRDMQSGGDVRTLARSVGVSVPALQRFAAKEDPIQAVFEASLVEAAAPTAMDFGRRNLGQMLPSQLAERVFATVFARTLGTTGLRMRDVRHSHSQTDFIILNGSDNPLIYLNVKFHGAVFRDALAMVKLPLDDCFGLATYKIIQSVRQQEKDGKLYGFAVVSVPNLAAGIAGEAVPEDFVHLASFVRLAKTARTTVEDAITRHLIDDPQPDDVALKIADFAERIAAADWRMLSANKAYYLLREMFVERVFAINVPRFAQQYKNAEVNMHFSLSQDLTPFSDVVDILKAEYVQGLTYKMSVHVKDPKPSV